MNDTDERRMGVAVRFVDHTARFHAATNKIIVNDFNLDDEKEQIRLNQLITMHCESDVLSAIPRCDCGLCTGEPLVDQVCQTCNTPVKPITERSLEPVAWMKPPEGVKTFINPQFWTILSKALTVGGVNLLAHLCNPMVTIPPNHNRLLRKYQALEIPQGINYFYDNFDSVMERLFEIGVVYNAGNRSNRSDLRRLIAENRDIIFSEALPIPPKTTFVTERTVTKTYADKTIFLAIDAINTITATVNSVRPLSLRTLQGRAAKANEKMAEFHQEYFGTSLARKPGMIRKHQVGTRMHFTFRAVISSLSRRHRKDEIHLPWSLSVRLFDLHLTNKLLARGFSEAAAAAYLSEHVFKYDDLLGDLFNEIIDEAPGPGFPVLLNRNPTLMRGSIQRLWVTHIKPDPDVTSISMSVLALKAPNADFDGDALNGMLIIDHVMLRAMDRLAPETGVLDLRKARRVSSNILIPAPQVATTAAWIAEADEKYADVLESLNQEQS